MSRLYNGSGVRVKSPTTCKNQSGQPTERAEVCALKSERERVGEWSDRKKGKNGERKRENPLHRNIIYKDISHTLSVIYF